MEMSDSVGAFRLDCGSPIGLVCALDGVVYLFSFFGILGCATMVLVFFLLPIAVIFLFCLFISLWEVSPNFAPFIILLNKSSGIGEVSALFLNRTIWWAAGTKLSWLLGWGRSPHSSLL